MTIISGDRLDPKKFFSAGGAIAQGSSFDLTIGRIFDCDGERVDGVFILKPGHIVQVASAEVFNLPDTVTGHVTYKTTLTQKGIWALTVGIVDPGWNGPVATTLLNFSRVDYPLTEGDAFLRVTMMEHDAVPAGKLRQAPDLDTYHKNVQKAAAALFPPTFLNSKEIAEQASGSVMEKVRNNALAWIAGIAILFTILQFVADFTSFKLSSPPSPAQQELDDLRARIVDLQGEVSKLRAEKVPPAAVPVSPAKGYMPNR